MGSTSGAKTLLLPPSVAGVRIPDSVLAKTAAQLAWSVSPEYLFNHCVRTFLFASLIYAKAGTRCDEELVFIASVLHDLGLVPEFMSPDEKFDIDGANAAEKFLQEHNVPRERSDKVWEAIALHAGGGAVARRRGAEVAAVGLGAVIDVQGVGIADFSAAELREILEAYPRLGLKKQFVQSIVELCRRKPAAQIGHFTAEIGRAHIRDFSCPTIESTIMAAPYAD
jgi:hypothetical protein